MEMQVHGIAFITGAGSGIGASTARKFAQCGISVLSLVDINITSLRSLSSEIAVASPGVKVLVQHIDVTDESSVDKAVEKTVQEFGKIDIAVHAAGIGDCGQPTHNLSLDLWQNVMNINQTGLWLCERAIIRQMLKQESRGTRYGKGVIVNVASTLGLTAAHYAVFPSYTAAKHAVIGLTKSDAKMYASHEIRINAVCPGWTLTPMTEKFISEPSMERELSSVPAGRMGKPDEIADAILFLASPMSSFVYGVGLVVDGGYTL
ncbi:hypothetical protein PENCOP_c002G02999 [Penicillium coprophilum]|uniref:Uncharacterized protein n=1 Tax=Penicillium coprophilum TaxID=36646 RepID=A0A1V6V348_9EURO|nr:hypothetical protein PENCOP_c002G02999 [Penicillium coprophilum]